MTQRDRLAIAVVIAVIATTALWFTVVADQRRDASAARTELTEAQAELAQATEDANASRSARTTFTRDFVRLARLGKALPVDDDVASLLYQLQTASRSVGADLRSLDLENSGSASSQQPASSQQGSSSASLLSVGPQSLIPSPIVLPGSGDIRTVPFRAKLRGGYDNLRRALDAVRNFVPARRNGRQVRGRLVWVDSFAIAPDENPKGLLVATLAGYAFVGPAATTPASLPVGGEPLPANPVSLTGKRP